MLCTYILKCTYYILCTFGNNNGHITISTIWKKCVFRTNIFYILFQVIAVCGYIITLHCFTSKIARDKHFLLGQAFA